jgi:hypothetical protein
MDKHDKLIIVGLLISFFLVGNAIAADNTTGGSLQIKPTKFISSNMWNDVDPVMPPIILIFSFIVLAFLAVTVASPLLGGIKVKAGQFLGDHNLRKSGWHGIIIGVGVVLVVAFAFIFITLLWNNYGPGSW